MGAAELHVEVVGDGPVVLLAHGFGGSARNFRPQVRALQARHRVVTYDARGHARSARVAAGRATTLEVLVDDMASVLDRAGASGPVVVGGLSLGAATALAFALRHPARVRGVVVMSPPPARHRPGGLGAVADAFARALEEDGLEAAGARYVWGSGSGLDERDARLVRQGFLEHDAATLAAILRGVVGVLPTPDELATELAGLRRSVLLLTGETDAGSRETAEQLAARLPEARHEVVPGAGHVVNLAAPDIVRTLLTDWLDRLPATAGISSRA